MTMLLDDLRKRLSTAVIIIIVVLEFYMMIYIKFLSVYRLKLQRIFYMIIRSCH